MKLTLKLKLIVAASFVTTTVFFNNCSKTSSTSSSVANVSSDNMRDALGEANPGVGNGGQPGQPTDESDLFVRNISIPVNLSQTPDATNKVKLLLVVDNSKTMRLVHERLSQSLDSLIRPLRNFQTEIKIITTSEIMSTSPGEELEAQGFSYNSWTYPIGSKPNNEEARILKATPNETFGIYSYGEYHFLNSRYRVQISPADPDIDSKLLNLKNMILNISQQTNGSSREQGLCNILLALHDRGPNQFFEKNDTAGILLLSDENDQSYWNRLDTTENRVSCRNRYIHGNLEDKTLNQVVYTDSVNFNIYSARFQITYYYNNDGAIEKRNRGDNGGFPLPYSSYSHFVDDLNRNGSIACPADFFNNTILKGIPSIENGTNIEVSGCSVIPSWTALYNFAPTENNVCSGAFKKGERTYASFEEYVRLEKNAILVPGSCSHYKEVRSPNRGFGSFFLLGSEDSETNRERITNLKESQTSIKKAILNQAQRLFGKEKFFMGNLVHRDSTCITDPVEQSLGIDYETLFKDTFLADRVLNESICKQDFTPVLQNLSSGIATTVLRTYNINGLKPYEVISKILIQSSNGSRVLLNSSQYLIKDTKITLSTEVALADGDSVIVQVFSIPE
ncbi:MAG: hypothetical protein HUU56_04960 [Bdellovibrionaceae bacterium]|nr:hypothetical protein [Pseudobdellovibrionaceae bacterium]